MPRIPTYTATGQLAVRRPTAEIPGTMISPAEAGVTSRALGKVGEALAQVGENLYQVRADQEFAQASLAGNKKLKEIEMEALQDTDVQDWDARYDKKLQTAREEVSKTIKNRQAKEKFNLSFGRDALDSQFRIKTIGVKTLMDQRNATLNEQLDNETMAYLTASTETEKEKNLGKMGALLQTSADLGIITRAEAGNRFRKIRDDLPVQQIDVDIENDTPKALEQLLLGEKGKYANVSASDRLTKITKANTKLEKDKKIDDKLANENHTKNEIDLTQKYFANQLTFNEIQGLFDSDNISQKYAGVLNSVLTSPDTIDARTDDATKVKMVTEYLNLDESKLDDLRKFRVKVLGYHAAGLLSRDDAEFLVNKTVDPFTQAKVEGKGFLAATIDAIKNWATWAVTPPQSMLRESNMITKLLGRVDEKSTEEDITKAGQDIIVEETRALYPGYAVEDLEATAQETGLSIQQVFDILQKKTKEKK